MTAARTDRDGWGWTDDPSFLRRVWARQTYSLLLRTHPSFRRRSSERLPVPGKTKLPREHSSLSTNSAASTSAEIKLIRLNLSGGRRRGWREPRLISKRARETTKL